MKLEPPPVKLNLAPAPVLIEREPAIPPPVAPRIDLAIKAEAAYRMLGAHDARLEAVAADLARFVDAGGTVDNSLADRVLRMHGIVEPTQHVAVAATRKELDAQFADERAMTNARIAVAATKTGVVGVLVYAAFVHLDPIPRSGGQFHIAGTLDREVTNPRIIVDGTVNEAVTVDGASFRGDLTCPSAGQHAIAIEVDRGDVSPRVTFPVYCGVAPDRLTGEPATNLDVVPEQMPQQLVGILDRERTAVNLPALHWNKLLERATASIARDRANRVESALDWHTKHAGILDPFVQYTVVHGVSFADAISQVLDDSKQNQKLFDGHNSDVAIAIVADDRGYWVAVGYLAVPVIYDLTAVQHIFSSRVLNARRDATEDPELSTAATAFARQLALGRPVADVLAEFKPSYRNAKVSAELSIDLDNYDITPVVAKYTFARYGVGLAQAPQDSASAGLIFIVLYFAPPPIKKTDEPETDQWRRRWTR